MKKYSFITKTYQCPETNHCFFSCIESFLADNSILKSTPEMIDNFFRLNLCNKDGLVYPKNMTEIGKILGIDIKKVDYHFPIENKFTNSLFIGTGSVGANINHMVRFCQHINEKEFIIMDPLTIMGLKIWDVDDLKSVVKVFYSVKMMVNH